MAKSPVPARPIPHLAIGVIAFLVSCAIAAPWPHCDRARADDSVDDGAIRPTPAEPFVIPPGQEDVLGKILGRGASLPAQCALTDGQINGAVVIATYTCGAEQVVFELRHPSRAPAGAVQTQRFAVVLQSGSPPAGLRDALTAQIRAHEADFKWLALAPPKQSSSRWWVLGAALLVAGLVAVLFVVGRMRSGGRPG